MAGFASYDDLISEMTVNGKALQWWFFKTGTAPEAAGVWHSLWAAPGCPGAGGSASGTPGDALTNADGSINFGNQSPDQKHILTLGAVATQSLLLMLYDRLVQVGSIALNSTGDRTVNSAALPRYTNGDGVLAGLEVTAVTTSAPVVSLNSYTDDEGNSGQSGPTVTFPAAATNVDTLVLLPLASGDKGVRAVSTVNVATASGGSAAANLVLLRPLAYLPLAAGYWNERDLVLQVASLPRVLDGASLGLAYLATTTTAANVQGMLRLAYG